MAFDADYLNRALKRVITDDYLKKITLHGFRYAHAIYFINMAV